MLFYVFPISVCDNGPAQSCSLLWKKYLIHELFFKRLERYLDSDFEDYCTCDDYYQPVVEDYGCNLKSNLEHWCSKNGFEFISCDGDGYDEGYQPKYRRGGW